jgi:phthalate 4,5-cis-dihydrodiol dehydrogenase
MELRSMTDAPLRFGIAGVGSGGSGLLSAFEGRPHLQLTAVADTRESALARFREEYGAETFSSVEEMCGSPNIDVVWVATPNNLHAEHAIAAARRGKHVIVSKPMAISVDECEAMNDAAERAGVQLLCGHTRSMAATIRRMAAIARSGEFGAIGMIHSWKYADWIYRPRTPDELDVSKGGGVVFRQGPHQLDIVRLIGGGRLKSINATVLEMDPARGAPGTYVAYMKFEDGTPATAIYSGYGHFDTSELTYGFGAYRRGRITRETSRDEELAMKESRRYGMDGRGREAGGGDENSLAFYGLTILSCEHADIRESPNGLYIYDDDGRREIVLDTAESRGDNEVEEMYQAVVNGKPLQHDGRWGEATLEAALAIMESSRTGQEIVLSHQTAAVTA